MKETASTYDLKSNQVDISHLRSEWKGFLKNGRILFSFFSRLLLTQLSCCMRANSLAVSACLLSSFNGMFGSPCQLLCTTGFAYSLLFISPRNLCLVCFCSYDRRRRAMPSSACHSCCSMIFLLQPTLFCAQKGFLQLFFLR